METVYEKQNSYNNWNDLAACVGIQSLNLLRPKRPVCFHSCMKKQIHNQIIQKRVSKCEHLVSWWWETMESVMKNANDPPSTVKSIWYKLQLLMQFLYKFEHLKTLSSPTTMMCCGLLWIFINGKRNTYLDIIRSLLQYYKQSVCVFGRGNLVGCWVFCFIWPIHR